ncbi:MAG: DegT/DnrJ/EryC1/StrS family aminotransferase [Chitinophagales bacterium]
MNTIQMVDLVGQYHKIKAAVDQSIMEILENGSYINGPAVKEFQKSLSEYLKAKHVVPCANGTDALQMALMALDLKPGDEVITTPFTFVATAEVIVLLGLKPVFVDVDERTFNIDPNKIEAAITDKTKVIIPVHLFGQAADMHAILELAEKHQLFVVEDNAQAIGSKVLVNNQWKYTGTAGDIGTLSFYPSKNLSCFGDGGALTSNKSDLGKKLNIIANHGSEVKYYHTSIGVNSRLDSIQAAVLNEKLKHLPEYTKARQDLAEKYDNAFADMEEVQIPYRTSYSTHVFHQYTLKVKDRDALQAFLKEKGIPSMVYYPVPLHQQDAYKSADWGKLPVSEKLAKEVLSLPMHTEMQEDQIEFIIQNIKQFYK